MLVQVFDVALNDQHQIVSNLDIFSRVGRAIAYDEVVPFTVSKGKLHVYGEESEFNGRLLVQLLKVSTEGDLPLHRWIWY